MRGLKNEGFDVLLIQEPYNVRGKIGGMVGRWYSGVDRTRKF